MIKLISFKICPFVQRVTATLEAKNIPYDIEYISLKDKPQWFLDISPSGQVPVLVTESGTALFESDAIVEYIQDEYGPLNLEVTSEQKALDRAWSYLATKNYLPQCSAMSSKDKITFTERSTKLRRVFEKAEVQLNTEKRFFRAEQLTNVDLAWLPLLHRAAIIKKYTCYDFLAGLPKTQKWQSVLLDLDLIDKTVSDDFEQLFTNFYLTNTHLGNNEEVKSTNSCSANSCCN